MNFEPEQSRFRSELGQKKKRNKIYPHLNWKKKIKPPQEQRSDEKRDERWRLRARALDEVRSKEVRRDGAWDSYRWSVTVDHWSQGDITLSVYRPLDVGRA